MSRHQKRMIEDKLRIEIKRLKLIIFQKDIKIKKLKQIEPESHSEKQLREMMERKFPQLKQEQGVKHG
jgi:hypothetical protein